MKYIFYTSLILIYSCKNMQELEETTQLSIKHTWSEVIAIAAKHGVDSTYIPYNEQSALMLVEKESDIATFALRTKKVTDERKQHREFLQNTYRVRNYKDYEALMKQYPLVLESWQNSLGDADFAKMAQRRSTGNWHIYRDSIGALMWVREAQDHGQYQAPRWERIDHLPPVGMPQK